MEWGCSDLHRWVRQPPAIPWSRMALWGCTYSFLRHLGALGGDRHPICLEERCVVFLLPHVTVSLQNSPKLAGSCSLRCSSGFCQRSEEACTVCSLCKAGMLWIISPLLGLSSFWDFKDLHRSCINSLCESRSRQPRLITSCCLSITGNMWV